MSSPVLLMGLDVHSYPPFRVTAFHHGAYERTGYDYPPQGADEAALYEHALGFLDRFIEGERPSVDWSYATVLTPSRYSGQFGTVANPVELVPLR